MVRAGIKKNKVQYEMLKKGINVACLIKKISLPYIQVNNPLKPKNRTSRM
jgi:hypothetical protein